MLELTSCTDSISRCIDNKYFSIAHLYKEEKAMKMHIHNCHEIYFSISGAQNYLISDKNYPIESGDIFVINQFEEHYLSQYEQETHERIVISVYPQFIESLCTEETDLTYCFSHRPHNFSHQLKPNKDQQKRFLYYINRILSANSFGHDILEKALFMELMVFLTKICRDACEAPDVLHTEYLFNNKVDDIMSYIHKNLSEPLSIESLSSAFYMSESYICRLFKKSTGLTINNYITMRRIAMAKAFLSDGRSVNEVCTLCGFNDYSTFFKAFTKSVGISPKKYSQNSIQ